MIFQKLLTIAGHAFRPLGGPRSWPTGSRLRDPFKEAALAADLITACQTNGSLRLRHKLESVNLYIMRGIRQCQQGLEAASEGPPTKSDDYFFRQVTEKVMSMPKVAESGRLGRAELLAKRGASGRMQRLTELVPIPESSVKAP